METSGSSSTTRMRGTEFGPLKNAGLASNPSLSGHVSYRQQPASDLGPGDRGPCRSVSSKPTVWSKTPPSSSSSVSAWSWPPRSPWRSWWCAPTRPTGWSSAPSRSSRRPKPCWAICRPPRPASAAILLTLDGAYLKPFDSALGTVPRLLDSLHQLTKDNRAQETHIFALEPLVSAKLQEMRRTVELAQEGKQRRSPQYRQLRPGPRPDGCHQSRAGRILSDRTRPVARAAGERGGPAALAGRADRRGSAGRDRC